MTNAKPDYRRTLACVAATFATACLGRAARQLPSAPAVACIMLVTSIAIFVAVRYAQHRYTQTPASRTPLARLFAGSGAAKLFTFGLVLWTAGELTGYATLVRFGPPPALVIGWTSALWMTLTTGIITIAASSFIYSSLATIGWEFYFVPRILRSRNAQDDEALARQVQELFHRARTRYFSRG
jgi:hypothetical protein